MKTSKNLKNIKKETENFHIIMDKYISGVKKDYKKNNKIIINNLLQRISIGENLDLNTLKEKYLIEKETKKVSEKKVVSDEIIFDKINIDGITYYVDKNLMWYYKPEIGIGLYGFEIFYSYNLFFKKQDAEDFDGQNMLNLKFSKQF